MTVANPVLVEVSRGERVESRHRAAAVVADARGNILFQAGDVSRPIYPRSAVKPLQALPLVASGAADRLGLTPAEIAITCGSHDGTAPHVAIVASMLEKAGWTESHLECGSHWPLSEAAGRELAARGAGPSALHNNCSGKHAGFLCLARDLGIDPAGYVRPEHPVMQMVTAALSAITSTPLDATCRATDGCSIPTFAIPLVALATAFARLGSGEELTVPEAVAAARIRDAVAHNPTVLAGAGRFDTTVASLCGTAALCKSGAEGTGAATVAAAGLGIAVKVDDGNGRAVEALMAALLTRFLPNSSPFADGIRAIADKPISNWRGTVVGRIRAVLEPPGAAINDANARGHTPHQ